MDNKKLLQYLFYYMGVECLYQYKSGENFVSVLNIDLIKMYTNGDIVTLQPILRPLSAMTDEEAFIIYKMYFGNETTEDWTGDTGSAYFKPKKIRPKVYHALRIMNGEDYETGDFEKVTAMVPFLLQNGFDIFGMIDDKLAIKKEDKHAENIS